MRGIGLDWIDGWRELMNFLQMNYYCSHLCDAQAAEGN